MMHRASAALGEATAKLGTVELEIVAQSVEQGHVGLCVDGLILAVYAQGYLCHRNASF